MNFLITTSLLLVLLLCAGASAYPASIERIEDKSIAEISLKVGRRRVENLWPLLLKRDGPPKSRQKRLSDQRRAELETLVALSKMTARLIAVSRSGRHLDPAKIG